MDGVEGGYPHTISGRNLSQSMLLVFGVPMLAAPLFPMLWKIDHFHYGMSKK